MGAPLLDVDGKILGHLAVIDRRPIPEEPRVHTLFRIFAARAAAELQRLRAETEVREREEKLGRLVESAMDAIIELDQQLRVTRMTAAAEKVFRSSADRVIGRDFAQFLSDESRHKLFRLMQELDARPDGERYVWIPGGLQAIGADGAVFPAEATLSRFELHR